MSIPVKAVEHFIYECLRYFIVTPLFFKNPGPVDPVVHVLVKSLSSTAVPFHE